MEVRLIAYARAHLIKKVRDMVKNENEYQELQGKLDEVRRQVETKTLQFENEVQELKTRVKSQWEFQRRVREIQQRANKAVEPELTSMKSIKSQLEDRANQIFSRLLLQMAGNEAQQVHVILSDFGVQNIHEEELKSRGRLGHGTVSSIRLEIDKGKCKELKKRMEKMPLQEIELFFEEL